MFEIIVTVMALSDLRYLSRYEQAIVLDGIEEHLPHQPDVKTRNRKPLRPNELADWALRLGDLRVFYDVDTQERLVIIKAVGRKRHNRLIIRGKEFAL